MIIVAVLAVLAGLWSAEPVAAANQLVGSSPAADSSVDVAPTDLQLTFKDPVGAQQVIILSCNGANIPLGSPQLAADTVTLTANITAPLPAGKCAVAWRVSLPDGGAGGAGRFEFTVSAAAGAPTTVATTVPTDPSATTAAGAPTATTVAPSTASADGNSEPTDVGGPLGLARLLSNLGLAALLGALVVIALAWPEGVEYILTVRFLRTACAIAVVGAVLTVICLTAASTGSSIGGSLSPSAWLDLKESTPGLAALARLALSVACIWVVARPERVIDPATQLAGLGIPALAVATIGFNRTGGDMEVVGIAVGVVHAVAMAVWLGGILLLSRVVLAGPGDEDLVHAVRGFRKISAPALILTVVTGLIQMYRLDWGQLFDTSHGRVLLVKALAVVAMVFVGWASREFIRTRMSRVETMSAPLATRLRKAIGIEVVIGVAVLALTAWMTSFVPGKLAGGPAVIPDLAERHEIVNPEYDLRASVRLTEVVGANAVMLTVTSPRSGLQGVQLEFTPPLGTGAASVILDVPLTGAGSAVLPRTANLPLDAPGTWTIVLRINNVVVGSTAVNVQPAIATTSTSSG